MTHTTRYITSLFLALWFLGTGMLWSYAFALVVAYPAGLISLALWNKGRKIDPSPMRYHIVIGILLLGLLLSLGTLLYFYFYE